MTESESRTASGETQVAEDNGNDHNDANDVEDVHPDSPLKWTHGCPEGRCFVFSKELRAAKGSAPYINGGPAASPPPGSVPSSEACGRHSSRNGPRHGPARAPRAAME